MNLVASLFEVAENMKTVVNKVVESKKIAVKKAAENIVVVKFGTVVLYYNFALYYYYRARLKMQDLEAKAEENTLNYPVLLFEK